MNFSEILKKLCGLDGISGDESRVTETIAGMIEGRCDEMRVDNLGNLIVFKKGVKTPKNKILIDAHTDEVGMIVTGFFDDGSLAFTTVGGIDCRVMAGRQVAIGEKRLPGVIGVKPIHMQNEEERSASVETDKLSIDIGCETKEEAMEAVSYGDPVCFPESFSLFGNGLIQGKAIDDRFGCAVMVELILSDDLPYDTWFSFSAQEEVGCRGATAAAFSIKPDYALCLEATTAADLDGVSAPKSVCRLGDGAVVGFMDRGTIYPRDLYNLAHAIGKEEGIPVQTKTMVAGGNNAGAIHKAAGGVSTLAISIPCRYIHSPHCVAKESDMDAVRALTRAMIEALGERE